MSGAPRKGSAKPFDWLFGSSTITVMRFDGAFPTSAVTASYAPSIREAMSSVQASAEAG